MSFNDFWRHYPRRVAKGAAMKAWDKIRPDAELEAKIHNAIDAQLTYRRKVEEFNARARRDERIFLPDLKHPATWIRAMCWEDELPELPGTEKPKPQKTMCASCQKEEGKYPVAGILYCIRCYDRAAYPENYATKLRVVK